MEPFSAGNSIFNLLQVLDDWLRGEREHRVHRPGEAGNGRQRITDAPLPGLSVRGIGTIGLPLIDAQAKVIIEKSTQARKTGYWLV